MFRFKEDRRKTKCAYQAGPNTIFEQSASIADNLGIKKQDRQRYAKIEPKSTHLPDGENDWN